MNTYIALFRGINVGGNNILPMKDLVAILQALGYEGVQTYIQSGNAVFKSRETIDAKGAADISREIFRRMGFEPKILLLSPKQLQEAIKNNPFPTSDGKALHFFFLEQPCSKPNIDYLESLKIESEKFKLHKMTFYLYAPEGVGRSKLAAATGKALGVSLTARNWNTVNKLASMIEQL